MGIDGLDGNNQLNYVLLKINPVATRSMQY